MIQRPSRPLIFSVKNDSSLMEFLISQTQKRKQVKIWLKFKSVQVNGVYQSQFDFPLKSGDQVTISQDRFAAPSTELPSKIKILFEDESILVIDKPAGLLSIATDGEKEKTAYFKINSYLNQRDPFKESRIWIVHRLDQGTSGIMVFAKNELIKKKLQEDWGSGTKRYEAVISGKITPPEGEIRTFLIEGSQYKMRSTEDSKKGQLAITRYKTLESSDHFSLLEIDLKTGRKNQIRVHLAEKGKPIIGDEKYGSLINPIKRLALHAVFLEFVHPITQKPISFKSPAPSTFRHIVHKKILPPKLDLKPQKR